MLAISLIGGSHALHDGFEVIRWRSAGFSPQQCSLLWTLSVASEVVVFLAVGGPLLRRLGPGGALVLSGLAGVVRWRTAACTAWFPATALVELLHGLTFAFLHLACMQVIARVVPAGLAATAQAFYATIAMGAAQAASTLVSGRLYGSLGAGRSGSWQHFAPVLFRLPPPCGPQRQPEYRTEATGRSAFWSSPPLAGVGRAAQ